MKQERVTGHKKGKRPSAWQAQRPSGSTHKGAASPS
jgi:hypothetical protein